MKVSKSFQSFQLSLLVLAFFASALIAKEYHETNIPDDVREENSPYEGLRYQEEFPVDDDENYNKYPAFEEGDENKDAEDYNWSTLENQDSDVSSENDKEAIFRRTRPPTPILLRPTRCPTLRFPCSIMPNVCANMRNGIRTGRPRRLNRITNASQIRRNRRASCGRVQRRPGFSCDEYPFASSRQGGRGAVARLVPARENNIQGGVLAAFYRRHGIGNGGCFRVMV